MKVGSVAFDEVVATLDANGDEAEVAAPVSITLENNADQERR